MADAVVVVAAGAAAVAIPVVVEAAAFPEAVAARGPEEEISHEGVGAALHVREAIAVGLAQGIFPTADEVTAVSLLREARVPVTEPRAND